MQNSGQTVQTRQLGRHLRELRREAGTSAEDAARSIRVHAVTLYRYEAGKLVPRPHDVKELCAVYGADADLTDALVALTKEAEIPGWWRAYNGAIPQWFDTFVGYESAATRIQIYDAELIPGLLQTRAYADATYRVHRPEPSPSEREQGVSVRMQRQAILNRRNPPELDLVIGESTLAAFGSEVMPDQLRRLDEMSRRPGIAVRVLPLGRAHCALTAGRFQILTFPAGRTAEPPLVFVESLCGALYLDKPQEIRAYEQVWEGIVATALTPGESRKKIKEYLERHQP